MSDENLARAPNMPDQRAPASEKKSKLAEGIDLFVKIVPVLWLVVGAWVAHSVQRSMATAELLTKREEADTTIRAEMFKAVTGPVLNPKEHKSISPDRTAVLVELLALNFHEHIELKPLMVDVDQALLRDHASQKSQDGENSLRAREELRSIARRIQSRQIAQLYHPINRHDEVTQAGIASMASSHHDKLASGELKFISVHFGGRLPSDKDHAETDCDVMEDQGANVCAYEPAVSVAPGGEQAIAITVTKANHKMQTFEVEVKQADPEDSPSESPASTPRQAAVQKCKAPTRDLKGGHVYLSGLAPTRFELTWFDFPLTDNTLLASGSRYALFINQVCEDKSNRVSAVKLGVLWFPSDYFPANERPTNYHDLRDKLGLQVSHWGQ